MAEPVYCPPVAVLPSPLHGRGVFATRDIAADERIGRFTGTRTKRDGPHVLWVETEDGRVHGIRGRGNLRFLNHSPVPNAVLHGAELWSLERIASGAEITIHYGPDWA